MNIIMTGQELSKKQKRQEAEKAVKDLERDLKALNTQLSLTKKKHEIVERGYKPTQHFIDNASMEYQKDPEYLSVGLELDKLRWEAEILKIEQSIEMTKKHLSAKKDLIKQNRG